MDIDFEQRNYVGQFTDIGYEQFIHVVGKEKIYGDSAEFTMKDFMPYAKAFEFISANETNSVFLIYVGNKIYIVSPTQNRTGWEYMIAPRLSD